jgi:hypothetical protein
LPATGIDARKQDGPHDDLLRSASALTVSTLWSMIESDTESMMFLAEGGGEVPLFEPREAPDDAVDPAAQTRRTKIERPADCAPLIRLRHLLPPQKARGGKASIDGRRERHSAGCARKPLLTRSREDAKV